MKPSSSNRPSASNAAFECTFCIRRFVHEKNLIKHLCRLKKRYLDRDKHEVRMGYLTYRIWNDIHYRRKKPVSLDQFDSSNVYDAFVKFGKHVVDLKAVEPEEFIRYICQSKVPIDKWCLDEHYLEYVRLLNKFESSDRAVERTLLLAESWANREGQAITDFFRKIATPQAVMWLMSGRISPWVVFNCQSGQELVSRFSNEQYALLEKAVDIKFWKKKFLSQIDEVHRLQDFLASEGI